MIALRLLLCALLCMILPHPGSSADMPASQTLDGVRATISELKWQAFSQPAYTGSYKLRISYQIESLGGGQTWKATTIKVCAPSGERVGTEVFRREGEVQLGSIDPRWGRMKLDLPATSDDAKETRRFRLSVALPAFEAKPIRWKPVAQLTREGVMATLNEVRKIGGRYIVWLTLRDPLIPRANRPGHYELLTGGLLGSSLEPIPWKRDGSLVKPTEEAYRLELYRLPEKNGKVTIELPSTRCQREEKLLEIKSLAIPPMNEVKQVNQRYALPLGAELELVEVANYTDPKQVAGKTVLDLTRFGREQGLAALFRVHYPAGSKTLDIGLSTSRAEDERDHDLTDERPGTVSTWSRLKRGDKGEVAEHLWAALLGAPGEAKELNLSIFVKARERLGQGPNFRFEGLGVRG